MLKSSILLLCLAATCLARPSLVHSPILPTYEHVEYTPTIIGHTVSSIPTAVSHQSQTIVHEKRPYLRPIVEHTPIVKAYAPATTLALPVSYAPITYSSDIYDHGWTPSYGSVYGGWSGWPLK